MALQDGRGSRLARAGAEGTSELWGPKEEGDPDGYQIEWGGGLSPVGQDTKCQQSQPYTCSML